MQEAISSVSKKEIVENLLLSQQSRVGILLVGVFYLLEYMAGFNTYGYNKSLEDFEEDLRQLCDEDLGDNED